MSWDSVKVSDFLKERQGRFKPDNSEITSLRRIEKIDFSGKIYLSDKSSRTDMILVKKGDLVISGINVCKGALAVYEGNEDVIATIHYSSYEHNKEKIDIDFLKRFLKSKSFLNLIKEQVPGGIKTEIKQKHLLPLEVSLPDLAEQRIIASKFQQTERKYNVLTTEITNQKTLLSKLKQSILQEAIQGKLTADWRKQNPELITGENSAEKLLERIKAEKEKLIKERKIKKEKTLPPIKPEEIPFELPDGWVWCKLGKIVDDIKYGTSKKCDYNTERNSIVLRIPNVSSGILILDDLKYVDLDKKEKQDLTLIEDDILIIRSNGSKDLVGKAVIVDERCNGYCYAGYLIRLRFTKSLLFSKYIHRALTSDFIREQIEVPLRTTVGINNINSMEISNLIIPLPLFSEQKVIVYKVNALMEKCNKLEQQITQNKKDAGLLMQAVLKEAFEGGNDKC